MRRKRTGRAALAALATGVVLTFGVLGAGAAQASTTASTAAGSAAAAAVQGPTTYCNLSLGYCLYNSGWMTYGDGSCEVLTTAEWAPANPVYAPPPNPNTLTVSVEVKSPYLFESCTAYSTVYLGLADGPPVSFGPFWGFACAELDPTCSDPNATGYTVTSGVPGFGAVVSMSVTDTD